MPTAIQTTFHAGEWAPALNARVDLQKYRAAVALAKNYFVDYRGGLSSRPGTKFIVQAFVSHLPVRLIPFQASQDVTYALEFGEGYMRPLQNGAPIFLPSVNITNITQANPAVVSAAGHTYANGDWVYISGVAGMTQVNNRWFRAGSVVAGVSFALLDLNGVNINSTGYGAYGGGGIARGQFVLPTGYDANDLWLLKYTQSVNKMILCHPDYRARVLTLISATNWTIQDIPWGAAIGPPGSGNLTAFQLAGSATGVYYGYQVTAVDANGEESEQMTNTLLTIQLDDMRTVAGSIRVDWAAVTGADSYNVYKVDQGHDTVNSGTLLGFIGNSRGLSFLDTNVAPDFSLTPPLEDNPFAAVGDNPMVPVYFQQRLTLGGIPNAPNQFVMCQPGSEYNTFFSFPIRDSDRIIQRIISNELNTIRAMVPVQTGLIIMTDRASWLINAPGNAPVTPASITANAQSFVGISDVPPIVAGIDILYVQAKGSTIRNLQYNFDTNKFIGTDISVLSSHLFYGYEVLEWCWAEEPFKLAYAVRNDGSLLNLTWLREQELVGWCHSDTDGLFKSVCSVTEETPLAGLVDAVYTVVERVVNGFTVKYIERFAERIFPNGAEDAICVDSCLTYDGAPASSFTGGWHLAGKTVTGLADGAVITPFVMPASGEFTLSAPASKVSVGIAYMPEFQTLNLDIGQPTIQGKQKQISEVNVRANETLGIWIGTSPSTIVEMKDFKIGNIGSQSNTQVTDLVTGDGMTKLDPYWNAQGTYYIQQPNPWPVSILGVMPDFQVEDNKE